MKAQWLSGRMLDLRLRGCRFEPQRRHLVVSSSKTHLSLLSAGSTQEDRKTYPKNCLLGHNESNRFKTSGIS